MHMVLQNLVDANACARRCCKGWSGPRSRPNSERKFHRKVLERQLWLRPKLLVQGGRGEGGAMVLWRRAGWLYYSGAGGKRESGENIGASCSSKYGAQPLSTAATLTDRYFLLVTNQHKRSFGLVSEMRKPMPSFFAIISVDELNTCKQNCSHF